MTQLNSEIVLILPPRERFRDADAGAVALTVRDFARASRYASQITIFGGYEEHFSEMRYRCIHVDYAWLWGRNNAYGRACIAILKSSTVKLVEVHNRIELALQIKKALPECKVVVHLHNDPFVMGGAKTLAQRQHLLNVLDGVYCVSDYIRQRILTGVSSNSAAKVYVVHNALALNDAQPAAVKENWIVFAGRFIPEKGVLELARALAQVLPQAPAWRAIFVGAKGFGHEAGKSNYEQQVYAALGSVSTQVEFRGHLPQAEVMAIFAHSSIAVVPSLWQEPFGRVALEAMSMGNAVVISACGGLVEIAGDAAILLTNVTPAGIAESLLSLLRNPDEMKVVANACQHRAIAEFALSALSAHLDAIRQQLLGE